MLESSGNSRTVPVLRHLERVPKGIKVTETDSRMAARAGARGKWGVGVNESRSSAGEKGRHSGDG